MIRDWLVEATTYCTTPDRPPWPAGETPAWIAAKVTVNRSMLSSPLRGSPRPRARALARCRRPRWASGPPHPPKALPIWPAAVAPPLRVTTRRNPHAAAQGHQARKEGVSAPLVLRAASANPNAMAPCPAARPARVSMGQNASMIPIRIIAGRASIKTRSIL